MRSIADTIERLARLRERPLGGTDAGTRLTQLEANGTNPGALKGWFQVPPRTDAAPALVVVLHGCTQTAADYDRGSGWSVLAQDYGFAVLFPEQTRQNNPNLCFNWFVSDDITRDRGEVFSIRQMIATMVADHGIDPHRIFVTGLSAGGAMANAMLAAYPDVFSGGAIIAGLPHATASTIPEAFDRMRGHGTPSVDVLDARLRASSDHDGPWPTISVWHGTADKTVAEINASAIVGQWRGVLGLADRPDVIDTVDGQQHQLWKDTAGRDALEVYKIAGMGHGTPLDVSSGYGQASPYMLDAGISSTVHIARNWGLTPSFEKRDVEDPAAAPSAAHPVTGVDGVRDVIEGALRAAGLMK